MWRRRVCGLGAALVALLAAASPAPAAFEGTGAAAQLLAAQTSVPPGFEETVAFGGLTQPAAVRFAPDGRVFVAEKGGVVKVFEDLADPTPSVYADLSEDVHDYWDRGLLGLALDPQFSAGRPYVYVLYAYNKAPGSDQVPRWPDSCPDPPGGTTDGCVISGRLSRLAGGFEEVLIEDWCQQFPSHSIGSLTFGQDGALYVSGGDGASFDFTDWGQAGIPRNPCGDPPQPVGGIQLPETSEGGALRSQDVRTTGDPTGLGGTILRLDPDTGAALPDNPNFGSPDPNARRIVAYGLRNPFRITARPGTNEIWAADVGWRLWEEIDRVQNPTAAMRNFGWPCYEGAGRMAAYDALNAQICESLYAQGAGAHAAPHFTYPHAARVVPDEACPFGGSSISGIAFTPQASSFPPDYAGALFFSDFTRDCIWVMRSGPGGLPDPGNVQTFVANAAGPAELQFGPGGDLYYVDILGGTIRRIRWGDNETPVARASATPSSGPAPLAVAFSGSASTDPDGGPLSHAWDLDNDGQFDDATGPTASRTYAAGRHTVRLRVTDPEQRSDIEAVTITSGTPPTATITSPVAGTRWRVGETIAYSGTASGGATLTWHVNLRHCDRLTGTCHTHPLQSSTGSSGQFPAPDHAYPAYLELELTAHGPGGLTTTTTRRLDPRTVKLMLDSRPAGVAIAFGGETQPAPFTSDVILGSTNTFGVASPQTLLGRPYVFYSWSNGRPRSHTTVVDTDTTLKATFERDPRRRLAGADYVGPDPEYPPSVAPPGVAEVYRTRADATGSAQELRLFLKDSTASALMMGLYADAGGQPGALLGSGRTEFPTALGWNTVELDTPTTVQAGAHYWIGLLNPSDSTGSLRWRDRANGPGSRSPELQSSLSAGLDELPTTWATGAIYDGGPASAYVVGLPPPGLVVDPGSLSFAGVAGGAGPPSQTLEVGNAAGGDLEFTASDDAGWLAVGPAAGRAPSDATVAVNTAGMAAGTYTATARVESPLGTQSIPVTLRLDPIPAIPSPPSGPVGAWGFDESGGRTAKDSSGTGNRGRLSGATRTRGRFGGGLSFDGRNDWVTVGDDPSLDLMRAMTLEAWVRPTARGWRSVLVKERSNRLSYALYSRPSGHVFTTAERALRGRDALPLRRWSHLAMTWDGRTLRMYVNGRRVSSHALGGRAVASGGPLRIGGNAIWPEFFKGDLDEVRVYDRALSAGEIARDRDARITPGARRPGPKTSRGGRLRKTRRDVHRGTRWLSAGAAALRPG